MAIKVQLKVRLSEKDVPVTKNTFQAYLAKSLEKLLTPKRACGSSFFVFEWICEMCISSIMIADLAI